MFLFDPNNAETHINHEAPRIPDGFTEALTRLGGVNTFGDPLLRLVWGQERREFSAGKMRLVYLEPRAAPRVTHTHTLKRYRFDGYDVRGFPINTCVSRRVIASALEVGVGKVDIYHREVVIENIGQALWIVEQYKPAHLIDDTPEGWEANRYQDFDDPEIGFVRDCDMIGRFPSEGRYEFCMRVGALSQTEKDEHGKPVLEYREPSLDVIEVLREALFKRDHTHIEPPAGRLRDLIYKQDLRRRKEGDNRRAMIRDLIMDSRHQIEENGVSKPITAALS